MVEGVALYPAVGVEGEAAVVLDKPQRGYGLEMVLDVGDVVLGELTRGDRIVGRGVAEAAGLGHRVVLGRRNRDAGVVVAAGDGDVDVMGGGAIKRSDDQVVEIGRASCRERV